MTGVYSILNLVTERVYVGSSVNIPQRWREHLSHLNLGEHPNATLQADWAQHGAKAFSWTVLEECATRTDAIRAEQRHIDSTPDLYNVARRAGSGPRDGYTQSDETKAKISAILKGKPKSAEHRAKLSAARLGKPNPAHGDRLRGRKHSPEHCEKIRIANTGKTHTDEHKAYMRELMTGRNVTWSEKISASKKGKPWSAKRRAMFEAMKTSVVTEVG